MSHPQPDEKYTPQKKLGQGATGEVWLATDTSLKRPVAIKYFNAAAEPKQAEQFLTEAHRLITLNHPTITACYDAVFDRENHRFYLVSEFAEGESLSTLINKDTPLLTGAILDIATGILQALEYAHQQGIYHQDLKPANVIIKDGQIKLTDFSSARLASYLVEQTQSEPVYGNPKYIAPEQVEGQSPPDGRADLYSLGVMLFEMVTGGHLPFTHTDIHALLRAHMYEPPPPVRVFVPDVPLILERTIMRLLSKSPRSRYASAQVVTSVLGSVRAQHKASARSKPLSAPKSHPFVNRKNEIEQIATLWSVVQQSTQPRILAVTGPMGIGKSRLLTEFINSGVIAKSMVGLEGRCEEARVAYAPFAQILTAIFNTNLVNPDTVVNQIEPILTLIPSLEGILGQHRPDANSLAPNDPRLIQRHFFEAVSTVLTELGPAVLFLEDAHWLDETSAALVRFLIRHAQTPLLLIVACSGNPENSLWLNELDDGAKVTLNLNTLSVAAVGEHLQNIMGAAVSESLVTMVYKHSQGNPSFVEELIRHLLDSDQCKKNSAGKWQYLPGTGTLGYSLPTNLFNLFAQRVQKLSEQSRQALAIAAIIGHEFEFDTWVAISGGESERSNALLALDEALDMRLLREGKNGHYIFHPTDIASVLASFLTASQQEQLHLQLIDYLLAKPDPDSVAIAYHYEQAGLTAQAAQYFEAAGARAMAVNAINEAITHYNRAVTLAQSQTAYEALGNLYRQQGAANEAIRAFNQALRLARMAEDYNSEARILNGLSFVLWLYDSYQEADEAAAAVLKLPNVSEIERAIAQSHLGMILWLRGQLMDAEYWCQKAVEALEAVGDKAGLAGAYSRLGLVYFARSQYGDARVMFNQSLKIRQGLDDYWGQAFSLNNLGKAATDQGDFEQADSLLMSAQHLFESIDSNDGLMVVYTNQARALLHQSNDKEALPLLDKALHLAHKIGKQGGYGLSDIYLLIAEAKLKQGEIDEALSLTNNAVNLVEVAGNQEYIAKAQALLAQIYARQDNAALAEETYQKAMVLFKRVGSPAGLLRTKLSYAGFLTKQGQADAGDTLERETYSEANRIGLFL